ncbi:11197_t:CDS:2, partial [Paraglomus occultum]
GQATVQMPIMLPTPNLDHLTADDYEHVYEPSEDTFLFLDALEKEAEFIKNRVKPTICLEIGSGSGCISTFLAQLIGDGYAYINPYASTITYRTGMKNNVLLDPITTDLMAGLLPRLNHNVDIICFNPPYVVTQSEDVNSPDMLERAWAGGIDGKEVIDRTLPLIAESLSSNGICYLLSVTDNRPNEIRQTMLHEHGLSSEVVLSRLTGREKPSILKFWRDPTI